jgi:hypothetical protein
MGTMPRRKPGPHARPDIKPSQVAGSKYLCQILDLLEPLHEHKDCPNRDLHYDELAAFILLYFFTPVLTSLRGLQQISEFDIVHKKLGLHRFSLGSFSESAAVFDPELLVPIIEQLAGEVTTVADNPRLAALDLAITAVDGTLIDALPKMVWALWLDDENRAAKMHLQFNVLKSVPTKATVTDGNGNERTALREMLTARMLYVLDRGYAEYALMADIIDAASSYVVRVANNSAYEVIEEHPVSVAAAQRSGIQRDITVKLGTPKHSALYDRPTRLVIVHVKDTSGRKRKPKMSSKKTFRTTEAEYDMLLATNLLDIDAELVAEIYRSRWQIELFFRWFKKILQADRLLCQSQKGLTIVAYCALIASLLVVLWTGRKPTKRTYELICFYFLGWVSEQELLRHLEALQPADTEAT